MTCRISLRHDQTGEMRQSSTNNEVFVFAPTWVKNALSILGQHLNGVKFNIHDSVTDDTVLDSFTLTQEITLKQLQMITRLEPTTVKGIVRTPYPNFYAGIKGDDAGAIIHSLRDLVRCTVIIGLDQTTHYGGYHRERVKQIVNVYICDLAGLQFEKPWNSGRLVLIPQNQDKIPVGRLDNIIFKAVVGEEKKTWGELSDPSSRYVKFQDAFGTDVFFDVLAYKKFVSQDVVLCGLGLNKLGSTSGHAIRFKFLKYGTGYFGGRFREVLEAHILSGVVDGLEILLQIIGSESVIKHFEFPFFNTEKASEERLVELKCKYKIKYSFGREDALEVSWRTWRNPLTLATTNCADTHAACGNEMGFGSVDSTISENLLSRGNIFCPCLNLEMREEFIDTNSHEDNY